MHYIYISIHQLALTLYKVVQRLSEALERQRRLLSITGWMQTSFFLYCLWSLLVIWYQWIPRGMKMTIFLT